MSGATVLITGATGFIGFRTLVEALKHGYTMRAAVRSIAKAKSQILAAPSIKAIPNIESRLSFVEVPDISIPGVYDAALADGQVKYIIHLASPLTGAYKGDAQKELLDPAVQGTLGILKSAAKAPSVQRVVITSSVVGNWTVRNPQPTTRATRIAVPPPPYNNAFDGYGASKVAAQNAADEFMATQKPAFDVVTIMPGFVRGDNELATDAAAFTSEGTAAMAIKHLVAPEGSDPLMIPINGVHVLTIAQMHVLALRPSIRGNQSFGAFSYDDNKNLFGYVKEAFPEAVEKGIFRDGPFTSMEVPTSWDIGDVREVFGKDLYWGDVKAQTVDAARRYIELVK